MFKRSLENIGEFILKYNTYFDNVFTDVVQDETTGIIHNGEAIFPNDTLGNYAYLRLPKNIRFDYSSAYAIAEGITTPGLLTDVILVACVRDADSDVLLNNLLNTISACNQTIRLTNAIWQPEVVITQELALIPKENIGAALQKLDMNYTIVGIGFTVTNNYSLLDLSCITNPCKEC